MSRRSFIGLAAAAAGGVLIAPGIRLIEVARAATGAAGEAPVGAASAASGRAAGVVRAAGSGASAKVRWGLLIDTTRCQPGCNDCVSACNKEHGLDARPSRTNAQWIRKIEIKEIKTGRTASVPMMCQHCAEPPCVDVCPTGASFKRADGIVLVDRHSCIGCRYCMMACPYKARSFVHEALTDQKPDVPRGKGCVESCTLCVHRIDAGLGITACAEACAQAGHEAIVFGDLNDPQSAIATRLREITSRQLRADLGLDPGVRYHGV
jgi:molybdopterin-containing oxidoreductase family iron-sulfur binding subunit